MAALRPEELNVSRATCRPPGCSARAVGAASKPRWSAMSLVMVRILLLLPAPIAARLDSCCYLHTKRTPAVSRRGRGECRSRTTWPSFCPFRGRTGTGSSWSGVSTLLERPKRPAPRGSPPPVMARMRVLLRRAVSGHCPGSLDCRGAGLVAYLKLGLNLWPGSLTGSIPVPNMTNCVLSL